MNIIKAIIKDDSPNKRDEKMDALNAEDKALEDLSFEDVLASLSDPSTEKKSQKKSKESNQIYLELTQKAIELASNHEIIQKHVDIRKRMKVKIFT